MPTWRQCNRCKEFNMIARMKTVQLYYKIHPIGTKMCLCDTCRAVPLQIGQRYVPMGD